jgi:polyhydroxybutyrate depolymerase
MLPRELTCRHGRVRPSSVVRLALLGLLAIGCTSATNPPDEPPALQPYRAGLTDDSLTAGVRRRFRIYVPATAVPTPKALVLVLHGGGGEGLDVSILGEHPLAVFRTVADREGFIVIYPEGLPALDGRLGWTDCRADNLQASGSDDVGFLSALIAQLRQRYDLPTSRVFMTGGSNGGQMTLAFAARAAEQVAAIAPGSANLPETALAGGCSTGPSRPLPILLTHGSEDPAMPYPGGCVANLGGACNRGRVIGAEATRDFFLTRNGLSTTPSSAETVNLDLSDAGPARRFRYDGAAPVEWWQLVGAGHTAPSRTVLIPPAPVRGAQNRDIEFAEVVWSFFASRLPD